MLVESLILVFFLVPCSPIVDSVGVVVTLPICPSALSVCSASALSTNFWKAASIVRESLAEKPAYFFGGGRGLASFGG